jgi:hypothetical protein
MQKIPFLSLDKTLYCYRNHAGSLTQNNQDPGEAAFAFENLDLAEYYLKSNLEIRAVDRRIFLDWHSQLVDDQVISALKRGAFKQAASYTYRGLLFNRLWPLAFVRRVIERSAGSLRWRTRKLRGIRYLQLDP